MEQSTWTLPSMLSWVGMASCSCDTTAVGTQETELRTTSMPEVRPAIKTIEAVEVDEEIRITVRLFSGRALILQATTLQTVADLKSDIQNKEQIPMQEQLLIFNEQSLKNSSKLRDYGISHDSSLNLVRVMPLELKIMTARAKWNIRLQPQDTVAEIKNFVNEKMSIPGEQMLFICKGKPLEDGRTLQEMDLQSGDQVALILRLKGCGQFIVETAEGDSFRVDGACADRTVADVKTAIRDRTGLSPKEQQLSYREQVLQDSHTLEHYGIKRECKIQLARRSAKDGCREACCFCY
mgnify:CR=1 FL=1